MKILFHTIALNRVDLLKQTINSIDTKYDWDILIHVVSKDQEILDYLKTSFTQNALIKNIGYNIGVSYCFNDALNRGYGRNDSEYDYVFFTNSDITFYPGDIDKMINLAVAKPEKALITVCGTHGKHKDKWDEKNLSHGFAAAILMPSVFKQVGYFDENIFPAYIEDCDYFYRAWLMRKLGPVKGDRISDKDSPLVECLLSGKTYHEGSAVIYSDRKLFEMNARSHEQNNRYYMAKWGGLNDHEVFTRPFDQELEAGYEAALYISDTQRADPYPEFWDRKKEKEAYYKKIK